MTDATTPGDVTIVLTLRGRHLHTLRWLWHANRTALPFPIVIADGDVHPAVDRLLANPGNFPNIRYEYRRYQDRSFADFYRKVVDAVSQVRTPYVMMSDNDDFVMPTGVRASAAFLDEHADFSCSGAKIAAFWIEPRGELPGEIVGPIRRMAYPPTSIYQLRDIADQSAAARAIGLLRRFMSVYYNVYRTPALRTIVEDVQRCDFSDLEVHEYFAGARAATLGKINTQPGFVCYLRQTGTSQHFSWSTDWIDHLLASRLPEDIRAFADAVSAAAAAADGTPAEPIRDELLSIYAQILRGSLANRLVRHRFPRLFAVKQFLMQRKPAQLVPGRFKRRSDEARLWRNLRAAGSPADSICAQRRELEQVDTTLQGDDFVAFVRKNAPELIQA